MSTLWILLPILVIFIIFVIIYVAIYPRNRVATNFNVAYIRALRNEGSKEAAITEALKFLRTFLPPFTQLTDVHIQSIAKIFFDLNKPNRAIQHLLQHAEKIMDIQPLTDVNQMESWKQHWRKNKEHGKE